MVKKLKMVGENFPLKNLVQDISKTPEVLGIILFGSYARNEQHQGSDVDLVVIYPTRKTARQNWRALLGATRKYCFLQQVLSFGKDELIRCPLRRSLIRDGIVLFAHNNETKETLLSMEVPIMGDQEWHEKVAKEKLEGVQADFSAGRFSCVGDQAIKVLEQVIEACVAKQDVHFHDHPASAHKKREEWLEKNHPDLLDCWETLWKAYGELGYGGGDGDLAKETVEALNGAVEELSKREELKI